MSGPVIFKDLPATFPEPDRYKKSSLIGAVTFHGFLILGLDVLIDRAEKLLHPAPACGSSP